MEPTQPSNPEERLMDQDNDKDSVSMESPLFEQTTTSEGSTGEHRQYSREPTPPSDPEGGLMNQDNDKDLVGVSVLTESPLYEQTTTPEGFTEELPQDEPSGALQAEEEAVSFYDEVREAFVPPACEPVVKPQTSVNDEKGRSAAGKRHSRVIALLLGMSTLIASALGITYFLRKKDYKIKKEEPTKHKHFQGVVSASSMALHNKPDDCWMELHGNVYDLTEYAPVHPGGPEYVTDHCGINATRFYDMEHSTALLSLVEQYNLGVAMSSAAASATETPSPTNQATLAPSPPAVPNQAASATTLNPTLNPTTEAPITPDPTKSPTLDPSIQPTSAPSTSLPTLSPTTRAPIDPRFPAPTPDPSPNPTLTPTLLPTGSPSNQPTSAPTNEPTPSPSKRPSPIPTNEPTEAHGCPVQYYSAETVSLHNTREDCWYILYGKVWDFTSYVDKHPGGARRVFEHCGTDAIVAYTAEKKHDEKLLEKKTPELVIGLVGATTGVQFEPCE